MTDSAPAEQASTSGPTISLPDVYTDGGTIEVSPMTITLVLATGRRPTGIVRMSPIYAKMLTILLKKYIKQAEDRWGEPIAIPDAVLKDRDISLDDW